MPWPLPHHSEYRTFPNPVQRPVPIMARGAICEGSRSHAQPA